MKLHTWCYIFATYLRLTSDWSSSEDVLLPSSEFEQCLETDLSEIEELRNKLLDRTGIHWNEEINFAPFGLRDEDWQRLYYLESLLPKNSMLKSKLVAAFRILIAAIYEVHEALKIPKIVKNVDYNSFEYNESSTDLILTTENDVVPDLKPGKSVKLLNPDDEIDSSNNLNNSRTDLNRPLEILIIYGNNIDYNNNNISSSSGYSIMSKNVKENKTLNNTWGKGTTIVNPSILTSNSKTGVINREDNEQKAGPKSIAQNEQTLIRTSLNENLPEENKLDDFENCSSAEGGWYFKFDKPFYSCQYPQENVMSSTKKTPSEDLQDLDAGDTKIRNFFLDESPNTESSIPENSHTTLILDYTNSPSQVFSEDLIENMTLNNVIRETSKEEISGFENFNTNQPTYKIEPGFESSKRTGFQMPFFMSENLVSTDQLINQTDEVTESYIELSTSEEQNGKKFLYSLESSASTIIPENSVDSSSIREITDISQSTLETAQYYPKYDSFEPKTFTKSVEASTELGEEAELSEPTTTPTTKITYEIPDIVQNNESEPQTTDYGYWLSPSIKEYASSSIASQTTVEYDTLDEEKRKISTFDTFGDFKENTVTRHGEITTEKNDFDPNLINFISPTNNDLFNSDDLPNTNFQTGKTKMYAPSSQTSPIFLNHNDVSESTKNDLNEPPTQTSPLFEHSSLYPTSATSSKKNFKTFTIIFPKQFTSTPPRPPTSVLRIVTPSKNYLNRLLKPIFKKKCTNNQDCVRIKNIENNKIQSQERDVDLSNYRHDKNDAHIDRNRNFNYVMWNPDVAEWWKRKTETYKNVNYNLSDSGLSNTM